jgi:hypothetical protein
MDSSTQRTTCGTLTVMSSRMARTPTWRSCWSGLRAQMQRWMSPAVNCGWQIHISDCNHSWSHPDEHVSTGRGCRSCQKSCDTLRSGLGKRAPAGLDLRMRACMLSYTSRMKRENASPVRSRTWDTGSITLSMRCLSHTGLG